MDLYSEETMESYRLQGEQGSGSSGSDSPSKFSTPYGKGKRKAEQQKKTPRLSPHVYQTADDAYRHMLRGLENSALMGKVNKSVAEGATPADQSILVSGESGAGKTVTTKIVLNYFAMLSKKRAANDQRTPSKSTQRLEGQREEVSIEQQVLQSNPILEAPILKWLQLLQVSTLLLRLRRTS